METLYSFDWASVKMEAALVIFAVLALLSAVALPRRFQTSVSALAFVGMYLALILACVFADRLMYCAYGCLIVICALLTSQMSFSFFDKLGRSGQSRNEYIAVVMMSAAGLILFGNTDNMMVAFVALECATICLYIMAAFSKDCASSLEAGVKYLIVGGFSGALMLMGIAFMYGAGRIEGVDFMYMGNFSAGLLNGFFKTGLVLVFAGVFFKIAAFPFQFWAPDVYQGAPTPSSAFFAVASKIAGVVFLAKICAYLNFNSADLLSVKEDIVLALSVIAGATIIVGNLGGITQMRTKRLLAFSGISNAGYLLVLIAALLAEPSSAYAFNTVLIFYLGAYMMANYALFIAVGQFPEANQTAQTLSDYRGSFKKHPVASLALSVNLASLAGIPPTSGFFAKLMVLVLAWYAQLYWLLGIMVAGSVVSIYYYFSWIRSMAEPEDKTPCQFAPTAAAKQTIVLLAICVLAISAAVLVFAGAQ